MDIHKRASLYKEKLIEHHFDPVDFYYYNTTNYSLSWDERKLKRDNFIDGLAWASFMLGSCFMYKRNELDDALIEKIIGYIETLDGVNQGADGRFARTYRTTPGDKWISSTSMPGYFFRDGQAKAGPLALTFAVQMSMLPHYKNDETVDRLISTYLRFINRFIADDFKITCSDGSVARHGDFNPYGITGIGAFLVYEMLVVAKHACKIVGDGTLLGVIDDSIMHLVSNSLWATKPDTVVSLWVTSMRVFDFIMRLFGSHRRKFSNDNLIYFTIAPWLFNCSWMPDGIRQKVVKAALRMHSMTRTWHNPLFNSIAAGLTGEVVDVSVDLNEYPAEKRRASSFSLKKGSSIVRLSHAKPSSWLWRRNPYEYYLATSDTLSSNVYAPSDFVAAYNIASAIGVLKNG